MNKSKVIAIISFILFVLITIFVLTGNISNFDKTIYDFIYGFHNNSLDSFFSTFTHIGDTVPVIIITFIVILLLKNKDDIKNLAGCLLITLGSNQLLKHIVMRDRPPEEIRLIKQGGYSFPSGHSMMSLCLYGFLVYLVVTRIKNRKLKVLLTILLSLLILMIGISRIYVGVHYPSDVAAGFLLSLSILLITIPFMKNHFKGE